MSADIYLISNVTPESVTIWDQRTRNEFGKPATMTLALLPDHKFSEGEKVRMYIRFHDWARVPCGPTSGGDEMFCACGCGGDDTRCGYYLKHYAAGTCVAKEHRCCRPLNGIPVES